ncbi:small GTP-binding protein Rab28, putative [Trypanosoma brucei brucei TREU927]|uniref:Small GTP-binding protein Rab28, putative n=1 Tax=Trypanosoma brucei brucei (strain 927/4 GUTat10.1) TaxID=185431 RepID=Q583N0_TRYB2|nr:small GTP-binding protein Rab28, putative [Trypanosoma brucei brucei TREU927]AAX81007.1 small GTP-binding protein Rab28, putative [Trypanosoma brucei]AAZ11866.1 small GTP-binding protein Rab28, putative [Trypanosoma brucei brucei TREU927]
MSSDSSDSEKRLLAYKVIVVGDGAVGKTSLIRRYCVADYGSNYKQTIGLDFYSKEVLLPGKQDVKMEIWDIGGQQIGGTMIDNYIMGAHAIFFVYDVTNKDSFKNIEDWHSCVRDSLAKHARETAEEGAAAVEPLIVLVGNKADLPNRQVSDADHMKMAEMHRMESCVVSACSGERVNALFTQLAATLSGVRLPEDALNLEERVVANLQLLPEDCVGPGVSGPGGGKECGKKKKGKCAVM